jgi:hypothetical protein
MGSVIDKVAMCQFLSKYFNFFLSIFILPMLLNHLTPAADTIGPSEAPVRRDSVSPHSQNYQPRIKIKKGTCGVFLSINVSNDNELQ